MGGDHHHGHHDPKFVVPDWRIYGKRANEIPILIKYQNDLAKKGLKDPWLRNEVWKFMPENTHFPRENLRKYLFRTTFRDFFPCMVVAFIAACAVKKYRERKGHGHGHGHDEH